MKIKLSGGKVWNVSKFGENIVELATMTVLPALAVGVFWAIWVVGTSLWPY